MAQEDDDARRRPTVHEIGQSLDLMSVAEIEARIEALRAEIERLEAARAAKQAAGSAAEAFFRK